MKTILITGASGNLGNEAVRTMLEAGYEVCATTGSAPLSDELNRMVADARKVDLTNEEGVKTYIGEITAQFPDLEGAVLLVGGFTSGGIHETDGMSIDKQVALNFKTAYFVVRPLISHFEKRGGGQFVLIGARPAIDSEAGKDLVAYSLSKSLVLHLANLINAFGHGKKIHATVLVPSTIDTPQNREAMPGADPSKWVKPLDIAQTMAFLFSDAGNTLRDTVIKVYHEA